MAIPGIIIRELTSNQAMGRDIMTRDRFLTRRWNNWLTLVMGLPTLIYVVVVLSTSLLSDFAGFVGLAVIGAIY
jgi:hypothetical protein